jgi:hypothetical protein
MRMIACDFEWEVDLDHRMQSRAHPFLKLFSGTVKVSFESAVIKSKHYAEHVT